MLLGADLEEPRTGLCSNQLVLRFVAPPTAAYITASWMIQDGNNYNYNNNRPPSVNQEYGNAHGLPF